MIELSDMIQQMPLKTLDQIQHQNAINRAQETRTAAFKMEMQRVEQERADENELRKRMDSILSDIMTVLKKSGDQIRQSS